MRKINVLHIIIGLNTGGAEMMLYKLLGGLKGNEAVESTEVISLTDIGPVGQRIQALGIKVTALNIREGYFGGMKLFRLLGAIKRARPDVVQTWMYHADLFGGLVARVVVPRVPVIWNIRNSTPHRGIGRLLILRSLKLLSRFIPAQIICNSYAGMVSHANVGYESSKMTVIPNGFDTSLFRPNAKAREELRQSLGIGSDTFVIGLVGRYVPEKGHLLLLQAMRQLVTKYPDVALLMCGSNVDWNNEELKRGIEGNGLHDRCYLLGRRDDVHDVMAAMDTLVLPSYTEGFPNVVGEGMACGLPCVVTDVGDAAQIVADTGIVIPPGDAAALASAIFQLTQLNKDSLEALGRRARARIEALYSIEAITQQYVATYRAIVNDD